VVVAVDASGSISQPPENKKKQTEKRKEPLERIQPNRPLRWIMDTVHDQTATMNGITRKNLKQLIRMHTNVI
jgi:hypothetical protein